MKILLACFALTAASMASAADAPATRAGFTASIATGKVHEECVRMEKNERRRFSWKTDAAVDFNIHYHEGTEVFYPLKRDNARRGRGTFRAKVAHEYCWMWTAKAPTKLEGKIGK